MTLIHRMVPIFAAAAVLTAAASLFVHPFGDVRKKDNRQPVLAQANLDKPTQLLFERACQNCHSELTVWPWYSYVAPVSWFVERDVSLARAQMNLSHWDSYSAGEQEMLLAAIGAAVRNSEMPPARFVLAHPEAALSAAEREQIYRWTRAERGRLRARLHKTTSAVRTY
jgi:hypothetical protein